ncbi:nicotinate-nucleotide--dimethylbenzimidazole phosphoribosyltransferase [Arachnia propionica]|uniref:Nicotinate-nucleotide--dimethylbenzimidazole phosphoribosyltransferase n=1 Tax=Arachnia propionica TaxID=1750 RepID=A0A3P1WXZ0_9ACTN|nr:nicotinate-nucleotide--dimethylbenzimidazole phosphoribosyltransferase [Arachnia propionica]RRD51464.1 nicotinate-nucleotide--dimethylbenzimidazole phosphoribosyltransferase [Arachnia propionica]
MAMPALTQAQLDQLAERIQPVDPQWLRAGTDRQNDLTKPPGSLGGLEEIGIRLCGVAGQCPPPVPSRPHVVVFAGDHGVYAQQVTPWPQEVSVQMAAGIVVGFAGVSVIARAHGARVTVHDVGLLAPAEGCVDRRIAAGTKDFTTGPAMSRDEVLTAIAVGIEAANTAIDEGADVVVPGEVGLANTTPAAALTAAMTGTPVSEVTGRGAGADDEMLRHKVEVIERGLEVNGITADTDPVTVLAAVGGFEHAAMVGFILVAASRRVPVVLDGVVSCAAALVARAIAPAVTDYLFAGHAGVEPAIRVALGSLGLRGLVDLGLRLGEGSGGALALPLVRAAALVMNEMGTFSGHGVSKA